MLLEKQSDAFMMELTWMDVQRRWQTGRKTSLNLRSLLSIISQSFPSSQVVIYLYPKRKEKSQIVERLRKQEIKTLHQVANLFFFLNTDTNLYQPERCLLQTRGSWDAWVYVSLWDNWLCHWTETIMSPWFPSLSFPCISLFISSHLYFKVPETPTLIHS